MRSSVTARAAGPVVDSGEGRGAAKILVVPDPLECAARLLRNALFDVLETSQTVRFAIPGGSALEAVPRTCRDLGDAWRRVALTWVDERCVALEDVESNRGAALRLGLFGSTKPTSATCPPACSLPLFEDGETPERAVSRATRGFRELFTDAIDVALLGMGADGHVASLFPPLPDFDDQMVAHIANSPKPPADRITLTRRALETAGVVVLVATGEAKREALTRLAMGDPTHPAQGLPGLVVVTDLEIERTGAETMRKRNSK